MTFEGDKVIKQNSNFQNQKLFLFACVAILGCSNANPDETEQIGEVESPIGMSFVFPLDGRQETPPVVTQATGECTGMLHADRTVFEIQCTHNVETVTVAHIHQQSPGEPGPVIIPFASAQSPMALVWDQDSNPPLSPELVHQLLEGNLYVNVHSTAHRSGELRGQINPTPCGNGVIDGGEACDDGNRKPGDQCDPQCAFERIPIGDLTIQPVEVVTGLASPVAATHAGDGSGRLFVVDQAGFIRIIDSDGILLSTPFLDLSNRIVTLSSGFDERGLLGLAFHPDYSANGRFFVRFSAPREGEPGDPCFGSGRGCHNEVLAEYVVSANDPNFADPNSERVLLEVRQPQFNHNGGDVAFGPDGLLYTAFGDGGGAHDGLADTPVSHGPTGHGQNIETLLGAMVRIDVDGDLPFEIPLDNPFVDQDGRDEIYAYGFRNPYRFSFDDGTGELILADVGQALFEEINTIENKGNYGWVIREGQHCFDPLHPSFPPLTCATEGLIDPFAEYNHVDGLAIVGGYVYRGSVFPDLAGKYIFADFSTQFGQPDGRLFWLDIDGDRSDIFEFVHGAGNAPFGQFVKGMGKDEAGEIYVLTSTVLPPTGTSGTVWRLQLGASTGPVLADFPACMKTDLETTLADACAAGDNPMPINPGVFGDPVPPTIEVGRTYGVRLKRVGGQNEGMLAFTAPSSDEYVVYLGTPNVPFRHNRMTTTCSRYLSPERVAEISGGTCDAFRGAYVLPHTEAGTEVRIRLGRISPQRWVRLLVLPRNAGAMPMNLPN